MAKKNDWWTSPTQSENGNTVIVTGRRDIDKFRNNPKFKIRIEVTYKYDADSKGMPDYKTSLQLEQVHEALAETFEKDPIAVLTGIYTGDGERNWVFYSLSTNIFGRKLNEALAHLPLMPIIIYAENDTEWNEYEEMKQISEIMPSDED